MLNTISGFLE